MFQYYGSKSRIAGFYPPPKFDTIVEPFAGAAHYSLLHFDKDVILIDKYDRLIDVWHYLQNASSQDILGLPDRPDDLCNFLNLSDVEKDFLGWQWNPGNTYPCKKVGTYRKREPEYWQRQRKRISESLFKIKHWKIKLGDFKDGQQLCNCTYFIDPPYLVGGQKYKHKFTDFQNLAIWVKSLSGQVVVCENNEAKWLPFQPLVKNKGSQNLLNRVECFYTNSPMVFQMSIF